MKQGFDNDKYIRIQSEHIKERIQQFRVSCTLNSVENSLTIIMPAVFCQVFSLTVNCECSVKSATRLR